MYKKPSFWNYIAGGILVVALILIVQEYNEVSEYSGFFGSDLETLVNFMYIPMFIGAGLVALSAFTRLPVFSAFGFFGILVSEGAWIGLWGEELESLSDSWYSSSSVEAMCKLGIFDAIMCTALFVYFSVCAWASPLAGKKAYSKAPMYVAIAGGLWKVLLKMIDTKEMIYEDSTSVIWNVLLFSGVAFYFAWVAFPTMERSFGETGPWNTPNGMPQNRPGYPPYGNVPQPPMPPQYNPGYPPQNGYPPVGYPGQSRSMPATPPLSSPVASGIIRTASGSTLEFLQSVRTVCNGCGQEMICGEYRVIMPDGYNSRIAYYCDGCVSRKTSQ